MRTRLRAWAEQLRSGTDRGEASRARSRRRAQSDGGTLSRPQRRDRLTDPRSDRRSEAGRVLGLVRALSALDLARSGSAWHVPRRHRAAAVRRGDGLRRAVPPADPSDRRHVPQGAQQQGRRRGRRSGRSLGDRRAPKADTRASTPISARSRISTRWWRRLAASAWRSRSTSPSRRRRITRGFVSIPNGSAGDPTARSSTPRTRPRSTRTSSRSTSRRPPGGSCGRRSKA